MRRRPTRSVKFRRSLGALTGRVLGVPRAARLGVAAAALAACATAPPGGGAAPRPTRSAAARDLAPADRVLSARDFETLDANQLLYDAIAGLRPSFLHYQGAEPTVCVDGARAGSVGALRDIPVRSVSGVRILSALDAAQRYGTSRRGAAIEVTTLSGR
jgi:hypothetical protein